MNKNKQKGFLLISLILAMAIIAVLYTIYMQGKNKSVSSDTASSTNTSSGVNVVGSGRAGMESLQGSNAKMLQEQTELQNQINGQ